MGEAEFTAGRTPIMPGTLIPPDPARDKAHFYHWLDAFRAIAAVMVMVSHARDMVFQDYPGQLWAMPFYLATSFGHTGVVLFFVMSGFWISQSVETRIDRPDFWRSYLIARLSRLWLVLLPALLLGGALDLIGRVVLDLPAYSVPIGSHSLDGDVATRLTLPIFLGNAAFLQTILVPVFGSNGPLWSLAFEFWYYLWFPVLFILSTRRRSIPWLLLLPCLAVAFKLDVALGFLVWLLGVAARKLELPGSVSQGRRQGVLAATTALLLAGMAANGVLKSAVPDLLLGALFAAHIIALRAARLRFPAWLGALAAYGRKSSFSLYAIHFPLVLLLAAWADGTQRYPLGGPAFAIFFGIVLTCLIAAWAFSALTERHTDAVRALAERRLPAPGAA